MIGSDRNAVDNGNRYQSKKGADSLVDQAGALLLLNVQFKFILRATSYLTICHLTVIGDN